MSVGTGSSAMAMRHACVLPDSMSFECPVLQGDSIDVHGAVAALCGDILVQRVPSDTLDVVGMLCDLPDTFACGAPLVGHNQVIYWFAYRQGPRIHALCCQCFPQSRTPR